MQAEPLSKKIYDKAKELGVTVISLEFSGGSDEGFLYVSVGHSKALKERTDELREALGNLESEIEDWVWEVYDYSGAGDGSSYGDNILYDLEKGTVSSEEWYTQRNYGETESFKLETVNEVDEPIED